MTTNEIMQDLLKMIGAVELLDEDGRPWWLEWDKDYWRWVPEADRAASTMCRYPREAQNHICMAAIEWLVKATMDNPGRYSMSLTYDVPDATWSVTWEDRAGLLTAGYEGSTLLEAFHEAVKATKKG